MKFNNKELAHLSFGEATIEGRLHHKKISGGYSHSVFKEKWFKLRANILFYFNLSENGQIFDRKVKFGISMNYISRTDPTRLFCLMPIHMLLLLLFIKYILIKLSSEERPVGAFILENVIVQYELNSEAPFSFCIYFNDEIEKKHLFSGRTQENINKWVSALKQASYEYWRSQLMLLQEKIKLITGQDPLLMYPRNAGCKHVFSSENQNVIQNDSKTKVQNSTFQSYITNNDKSSSNIEKGKGPVASILGDPQETLRNEISNISINESPPIRPSRGNKQKQEVCSGNLIDL